MDEHLAQTNGDALPKLDGLGAEVHQASGILLAQLGVTIPEALALLRAHADATKRPLADVARDIIAHRVQLGGPRPH